jgi:hypothetical protein
VRSRPAATLLDACHRRGSCTRTIPSSSVTRQTAQGCSRCARLHEGICQVATKRAHKSWARWGKTVQPVPLTSSYSTLQGTNRYSGERVILGPHGRVTFAGFFLTKLSQFHPISTRMSYPIEGRSKHEGKVTVSRSASLPGGVNHAGSPDLLMKQGCASLEGFF